MGRRKRELDLRMKKDGVFDKAGNEVSGPPPEPLHRFQSQIENDEVMIYVEA
jgi:Rieske Fe-S protein